MLKLLILLLLVVLVTHTLIRLGRARKSSLEDTRQGVQTCNIVDAEFSEVEEAGKGEVSRDKSGSDGRGRSG